MSVGEASGGPRRSNSGEAPSRPSRCLAVGLLVLAAAALVPGSVFAEAPAGPRLAFGLWKLKKPGESRLETIGADGVGKLTLVKGKRLAPSLFDSGSWLPDGSAIVFAGSPRGEGQRAKYRIYLAAADGSGVAPVPGTLGAHEPVVSPDGTQIAFTRTRIREPKIDLKPPIHFGGGYFGVTTWVLDRGSGEARRLTPWRNNLVVSPTSYSPDGSTLVLDRNRGGGDGPEVVFRDLTTQREQVFARNAEEAVFSPDGLRLALISYRDRLTVDTGDGPEAVGELYVAGADGSGWRRLSRTEDRHEATPSWDPSGQRLAFTRDSGPEWLSMGTTNVVMTVNADGTCPTAVFGSPRTGKALGPGLYAPTWQPGPGREAGPIAC
jgi:hypothetical protein